MAHKADLNTEKPRRRRGRPTKQEELQQTLAEIGCDPLAVDPLRILAGIAADETTSSTARVAAAKALLVQRYKPASASDTVTERAIRLMAERRERH